MVDSGGKHYLICMICPSESGASVNSKVATGTEPAGVELHAYGVGTMTHDHKTLPRGQT